MATRVKHLRITTSLTANGSATDVTNHTTNTPSTTGDITTRVLIDRITVAGLTGASNAVSFQLTCGGIIVTKYVTNNAAGKQLLVLSGSNSTSYNSTGSGGLQDLSFTGSGMMVTSTANFHHWFCPAQFYSQVGDTLQILVNDSVGSSVSVNLNLVCIGEY